MRVDDSRCSGGNLQVKIGDLVKYRTATHSPDHSEWLGLIVREIPGTDEIKVIE